MITQPHKRSEGVFGSLLILTVFFVLLELSYFIQCNRGYLSDYTFVSDNLHIPLAIFPGIIFYLAVQLALNAGYCIFIWLLTRLVNGVVQSRPFHLRVSQQSLAMGLWFLGCLTIITANQCWYPNSKFTELSRMLLLSQPIAHVVFTVLLLIWAIVLVVAFIGIMRLIMHSKKVAFSIFMLGFISAGAYFIYPINKPVISAATATHPNIIVIGIDSLRPDFLSFFGADEKTPFLDSILNQSLVFSESITPLARTFPSWSAILTGQYPREIEIRSNLSKVNETHFKNSLPSILQRNGYHTVYATDETRFSNITSTMGFNQIISPPVGLNDFLIGTFNDFPLSNLLVNTWLGKWLFPYSYANRPVYFTYDPTQFLSLMKPVLKAPINKPLFLAVHFCLPHYPYLWADIDGRAYSPQERYVKSIARVDTQIRDLFTQLEQAGLLKHALIVLLSDHGEALELPGDRITEKDLYRGSPSHPTAIPQFYPPSLDHEEVNQSAGHGTDVLGLPQYHTLFAIQERGIEQPVTGVQSGVVSLLDIKPTLLDLLHIPIIDSSGTSLARFVHQQSATLPERHLFLESDFSPESIRTVYPEARQVLLDGIDLFEINPQTTRLTVKDAMAIKIIRSKQYADIYQNWMLAFYPQNKDYRMPILVNLETGLWTNDLHSSLAMASPANEMVQAMRAFYGDEIR